MFEQRPVPHTLGSTGEPALLAFPVPLAAEEWTDDLDPPRQTHLSKLALEVRELGKAECSLLLSGAVRAAGSAGQQRYKVGPQGPKWRPCRDEEQVPAIVQTSWRCLAVAGGAEAASSSGQL